LRPSVNQEAPDKAQRRPECVTKSKAVKLPVKLIDLIKGTEGDKPPGEVLLNAYTEYLKLKTLADVLADMDGKDTGRPVSDVIIMHVKEESSKYEKFDESLTELSAMVQGLSIFFKKFGGEP